MKIGLDTAPVSARSSYFQDLADVLAHYAPEHEYVVDAKRRGRLDLYHGFRSSLPLSVHLGRVPAVMTVPNLNFLRYPGLYSLSERLIALLRSKGYRVATRVTPAGPFWPAETCHQDYYRRRGTLPYCHAYTRRF